MDETIKPTPRPWQVYNDGYRAIRISGEPDGDVDDAGRMVDRTLYVCEMDDSPSDCGASNAAMIVECVNGHAALLARAEAAEAERDERQAEAASMAEDLRAAEAEAKRLRVALAELVTWLDYIKNDNNPVRHIVSVGNMKGCVIATARAALAEGGAK